MIVVFTVFPARSFIKGHMLTLSNMEEIRNKMTRQIINTAAILLATTILLAGCGLPGSTANPSLPTIVPAQTEGAALPTDTPLAPTPTSPPAQATEETPIEPTEAASETEMTEEPAPTETAAPTESPTETALPEPTATEVDEVGLPLETLTIGLNPVAEGFTKPLFLTYAGDGTNRLFVIEQAGRILLIEEGAINPTPFLDIVSIVGSDANEQGLLSVAFHPDYQGNGRFFIYYTNKDGDAVIARYQVSSDPNVADPASGQVLLTVSEPYANHNGGQVAFGADGYLYIGLGDGGAAGDPQNNAQNLDSLLGKILRVDVDRAEPYGVPEDNPFVTQTDTRPEIWSYGWRNPWRFSFDPATADLYVADVGQNQYEEVHVELAGSPSGQNYGWRLMEGFHCYDPAECDPTSLNVVLPVTEYSHDEGCSVTGGYIYRGSQFPALNGVYLYGDYCTGFIWGLRREADGSWSQARLLESGHTISSFGQDEAGEVYLVDHKGSVWQVTN